MGFFDSAATGPLDDFETENDPYQTYGWPRSTAASHSGSYSRRGATTSATSSGSTMIIPVPYGDTWSGTSVSFWFYTSAYSTSYFAIMLDDLVVHQHQGSRAWAQMTYDTTGVSYVLLRHWRTSTTGSGLQAGFLDDLQFTIGAARVEADPAPPGRVVIAANNAKVIRSDNLSTWEESAWRLDDPSGRQAAPNTPTIDWDPLSQNFFALGDGAGWSIQSWAGFHSPDGEQFWTPHGTRPGGSTNPRLYSLLINRSETAKVGIRPRQGLPPLILSGGEETSQIYDGYVARSEDGGRTWDTVSTVRDNSPRGNFGTMWISELNLWVFAFYMGTYTSDDDGVTLTLRNTFANGVSAHAWSPSLNRYVTARSDYAQPPHNFEYTSDFDNWTTVSGLSVRTRKLIWIEELATFFAHGHDTALGTSADGITWTESPTFFADNWNATILDSTWSSIHQSLFVVGRSLGAEAWGFAARSIGADLHDPLSWEVLIGDVDQKPQFNSIAIAENPVIQKPDLTLTVLGETSIEANWSTDPAALAYDAERQKLIDTQWSETTWIPDVSPPQIFSGLEAATRYRFRARGRR